MLSRQTTATRSGSSGARAMSVTGRIGLGVASLRRWLGLELQVMPPSLLFHRPGLATGGGVALGISMAYMVLPSGATATALSSQGERRSFLSAVLPGVSTMAQLRTAVSGGLASAGAGDGVRLAISRIATTKL